MLGGNENKQRYLYKPTVIDGMLAATVLPFFPRYVTPNQITVFRFVTIPFIIWFLLAGYYISATILFLFSAALAQISLY